MATESQSATLALPLPPGTEAILSVTCKDVVMGRGSGTQNHCGNVTYRKLVYLNKELYATSSKFDKIKISRAIVAATRWFGGRFVQADPKRGGLYFDIGDKPAWSKTSQALREGQAEVRTRLAEEDPTGMSKIAEYKQVISEQTFFAYACRMMQSLCHPANDGSGISACGPQCPYAVRRRTLNQLGADPLRIYSAMQMLAAQPLLLPPSHIVQQYQPYNMGMISGGTTVSSTNLTSSATINQGNIDSTGPLSLPLPNAPENTHGGSNKTETTSTIPASLANLNQEIVDSTGPLSLPLPNAPENTPGGSITTETASTIPTSLANFNQGNIDSTGPLSLSLPNASKNTPGGSITTETATPTYTSYPNSLGQVNASAPTTQRESFEPLPYQNESHGPLKLEPVSNAISGGQSPSGGSVFALRKFCSKDREISSEEGHALMDQEVHDLIRRKSRGLIKIDTTQAFEDLLLAEDNVTLAKPKEDDRKEGGITPKDRANSGSSSSGRSSARDSSSSKMSNVSGMYSNLSHKDDSSLMNMSFLSLDIEKGGESNTSSPMDSNSPDDKSAKDGSIEPKSVIKQYGPSLPFKKRKREYHVSWAGKRKNISLMSMDDRSFTQLVESISDPHADEEKTKRISKTKGGSEKTDS